MTSVIIVNTTDIVITSLIETKNTPSRRPERTFCACTVSDVARPCGLDGTLRTRRLQGPVLVRSKKLEAPERRRYMRPELLANAFASEATRWSTRTLTWLLLRALLLKEPATVVDTVPMPTLSPPRSPIRARDEMRCASSSLHVGAYERMARITCEPPVAGKEPRGVCMCIDLVSSSSIDDTVTIFSESDVLTWSIPTVRPVTTVSTL